MKKNLCVLGILLIAVSCASSKPEMVKDIKNKAYVKSVMSERLVNLKNCYQREIDIDKNFSVKKNLILNFKIERNGYISKPWVKNFPKGKKYNRFLICLKNVAHNFEFIAHNEKKSVKVSQPIVFNVK